MAYWLKILLFGGGVAVAGVGTAYLTGSLDPWVEPEQSVVAALPEAEALPEPAALRQEAAEEVDESASVVEEETSETADGEDLIIPAFDLVRVEPDGSVVIAGRAAPDATVEVLTGSRVIATVQAGPDGDFAAVLDDPLEPGDYQIVLRSTTADNVVVTSVETAIVSVPETQDGQVLALVEQPGSPSRLITVPDASDAQPIEDEADIAETPEARPDEDVTEAAEALPEGEAVADAAEDEATEADAAPAETAETELAESEADITTEEDLAGVAPTTEEPAAQPDETAAEAETAEQDLAEAPSAEEETVVSDATQERAEAEAAELPSEATEEDAAADTAQTDEPGVTAEATQAEEDVAALEPEAAPVMEAPQPAGQARVFVEAVEIDGGTVFVAGHAEAGRFVRVYANDILLGETRTSEGGRFLIEARVDLPVGDYIIRADLLGSDGSVVARAAVPFEREPGETIAAVAPRAPSPGDEEEAAQPAPEEEVSTDTARIEEDEADSAPSEIAAAPVDGEAETEETSAAHDPVVEEEASADVAAVEPSPSADVETTDAARTADQPEQTTEPAADMTGDEQIAASEEADAPAPVEETAQADEPEAPASSMAAADPAGQTMSPALERVDGAVIIRRGDNLWRISRRVYGQGVRFSTIYLANQDQIRDPDRIWPGQVFTVPAETAEGEAADLEALGEQAVDPSQVPGEIIR
ncbi:MAG: LysM peptidoglycan-binding domain-containing protein [Rhizobiaceae bacterium]